MSPLRRLFGYVGRYRRAFALGLACTVMTQALALASPKILQYAIDDLTRSVTRSKLFVYGLALLALGLVGGVFRFFMRQLLVGASRGIEYDMRNDFFAHLEKLPASYFQRHRTGDLMSRATNDLNAVRMMVGPSIMYTANTVLTFVVAVLLMLSIDVRLTLLALIPLPFVTVIVKLFGGAIHRRFEQIQAQLSDMSAVAQEALAGVRVVRAYRQEHAELERFRRSNAEYVRRNRGLITLQGIFFPSMSMFLGLGAMIVLWVGSSEVIRGRITVGEFVAFNVYLAMLSWPMIAFGWVTNTLQRGTASWKRMLEVLETEPSIVDSPAASARQATGFEIKGAIELRDLTFAYADPSWAGSEASPPGLPRAKPEDVARAESKGLARSESRSSPAPASTGLPRAEPGDVARAESKGLPRAEPRAVSGAESTGRPVLRNVSAIIPAGTTVALVGPTGSGKSTILALLARVYDPPPGTVFIDGVDVREIPLGVLRRAIGFVPQEPFLFSDTLADNIAFGLDALDAELTAAHASAGASASRAAATGDASHEQTVARSERMTRVEAAPAVAERATGETSREQTVARSERVAHVEAAAAVAERVTGGTSRDQAVAQPDRMARVEAAAAVARVDKDVVDFPLGYSTMVGERGITLSGGQKQRTAIARAIAIDPRILILDDALSAVDTYTEDEILSRLVDVLRQRTAVIVSHRISTVRRADLILVLDDGRIVERGTHDELVGQQGLYAELHQKQLLEEELAAS